MHRLFAQRHTYSCCSATGDCDTHVFFTTWMQMYSDSGTLIVLRRHCKRDYLTAETRRNTQSALGEPLNQPRSLHSAMLRLTVSSPQVLVRMADFIACAPCSSHNSYLSLPHGARVFRLVFGLVFGLVFELVFRLVFRLPKRVERRHSCSPSTRVGFLWHREGSPPERVAWTSQLESL